MRGFSLVEMLVVLSIIAVITTMALVSQSSFNRSLYLTDTAYSMALSIRQAQTLGVSSRAYNTTQNAGYGVYVSKTSPYSYVVYADTARTVTPPSNCLVGTTGSPDAKPGDCVYAAGSDGIVETNTFGRGFRISNICATISGTRRCSATDTNMNAVSITYLRSVAETMGEALYSTTWQPITKAEIYISSSDASGTRGICISQVGQVSVATSTCP